MIVDGRRFPAGERPYQLHCKLRSRIAERLFKIRSGFVKDLRTKETRRVTAATATNVDHAEIGALTTESTPTSA
jgi:hypothetical protein